MLHSRVRQRAWLVRCRAHASRGPRWLCGLAGVAAAAAVCAGTSSATGSSVPTPTPLGPGVAPTHVALGQTPSDAAPDSDYYDCGENQTKYYMCFWQNAGYSGTLWEANTATYTHDHWWYIDVLGNANDQTSSILNLRPDSTLLGKDYPPSEPDVVCIPAGDAYNNLTKYARPDGSGMTDTISSFDLQEENDC